MPGPEILERAGLMGWPGVETDYDGTWIRRAANGYTKRANSTQPLDPADDGNAAERIAASCQWFSARGLTPIFRMTPLAGPAVKRALDAAGWRTKDQSLVLAMELGDIGIDASAVILAVSDPQFLIAQRHLQDYSAQMQARFKAVLDKLSVPACGIVLYSPAGEPLASALVAVADGISVTGNVITSKAHRRQGHAATILGAGHAWARSVGATIASLNVAADNPAARALYRSLGYRQQYEYCYRLPGAA